MVSGADRNALLLPLLVSSTDLFVPLHALSAFWIREVSGGLASLPLENCSLLVARLAVRVWQTPGSEGWLTERLSPVATLAACAVAAVSVPSTSAAAVAAAAMESLCALTLGMAGRRVRVNARMKQVLRIGRIVMRGRSPSDDRVTALLRAVATGEYRAREWLGSPDLHRFRDAIDLVLCRAPGCRRC